MFDVQECTEWKTLKLEMFVWCVENCGTHTDYSSILCDMLDQTVYLM